MTVLPGSTVRLQAEFVSPEGTLVSPDNVKLHIRNKAGITLETFEGDALTQGSDGVYYKDYVLPQDYKELTYEFYGEVEGSPVRIAGVVADVAVKEELLQWVKLKMGNPTDPNMRVLIENAIYDALDDLSRLRPITGYRTLNLKPQVSTYLLDDDVIDVQDCWLGLSPNYSFGHDLEAHMFGIAGGYEYVDINTFHNPSLILMLEQKWESLRDRYSTAWEYDPDTNSIRVIPAPSQVGKAVYKYAAKRTLADLPQKYMAGFKSLVFAECLEATEIERNRISSIPVGIGSVTFNTAPLDKKIEQLRQDAYRKLGIGGGGFVIG